MKKQILKKGSDSSSELSINENSEQESNSFIIQTKRKIKKTSFKQKYLETSPNKRFGKYEEKKFSEINHTAYLGVDHDRGCDVLWNVINISCLNTENKKILISKFKKFKNLHHENVSALIDFWEKDQNTIIFITDYFTSGSIRQYLMKIGKQKLKVVKSWFKMILYGLEYLHKQDIYLKNLNCGRIFYNGNNGIVSIGEIYTASKIYQMIFYDNINSNLYSEKFMINCVAPEVLNNCFVTDKSDIYSLGMVLIEMLSLEIPFNDVNSQITIREKIIDGNKPITIEKINDINIRNVLDKLLEYDSKLRPSIKDLFNYDFIKINEKEDNRIVPIIKLKRKNRRQINSKIYGNFNNKCKNNDKINYTTTPYQSNVPDDYLHSSININIDKQDIKNNIDRKNSSNKVCHDLLIKNYRYSGICQYNYLNSNLSNISLNNCVNSNNTINTINDNSHDYNRRVIHNMSKKTNRKKSVLFKHVFEENPYFEESLRMKIENEIESSNINLNKNTFDNQIFSNYINTDININSLDIGDNTPSERINNEPNYYLNQINLTNKNKINEIKNYKNNSNKRKRSSLEIDEEYDYYADNNKNNSKQVNYNLDKINLNNLELLSSIDNNYKNSILTNRNINANIYPLNQNYKYLSYLNKTYPDNVSSINCNYNKDNQFNSSQANTIMNSNIYNSCLASESNINGKSQTSNNSSENHLNCINLSSKSNADNKKIFSKNNLLKIDKDKDIDNNDLNNKNNNFDLIENEKEKNNKNKEKNECVNWLNIDKNYLNYGKCIKDENYDLNKNKIEDLNFDRIINNNFNQESNINKRKIVYDNSSPNINLNQIIENNSSQNSQFNACLNNFSNEVKNDFDSLKFKNKNSYSLREKENLNESKTNINNASIRYSRDSSSITELDHILENNQNNKIIKENYSNTSSEKFSVNLTEKDTQKLKLEDNNLEGNKPPNVEKNPKQNFLDDKVLEKDDQHNKQLIKSQSENILNISKIKYDSNKNIEDDKYEKTISNKNINNDNCILNEINNCKSDSLLYLKNLENKKEHINEDEEYANLANKNIDNRFDENIINEYNNKGEVNINIYDKPKFQIYDANYDVHLKFLINQDSKIHEIQFTYNLVKDNIPDLINEIQNEFNFSSENLNHIYETLKKISIYSKFYSNSDILHDNSF